MILSDLLSTIYPTERIRLTEKSSDLLGYYYKKQIPKNLLNKKVILIKPSVWTEVYDELNFDADLRLDITIEG